MRTKLFCLCVFLLLATGLAFAACAKNPAAPSDVSAETSGPAAASDGGVYPLLNFHLGAGPYSAP